MNMNILHVAVAPAVAFVWQDNIAMDSNVFCEDVLNAVCDYCADGIDAFEK